MKKVSWLLMGLMWVVSCSRTETSSAATSSTAQTASGQASSTTAGQPAPATPAQTGVVPDKETAVFTVPGIDDELVRKFGEALAGKEGLISAQADKQQALFKVTFSPAKISGRDILELLQKVKPEVSFQKVENAMPGAEGEGHKCGGCPYRNTCQKEH